CLPLVLLHADAARHDDVEAHHRQVVAPPVPAVPKLPLAPDHRLGHDPIARRDGARLEERTRLDEALPPDAVLGASGALELREPFVLVTPEGARDALEELPIDLAGDLLVLDADAEPRGLAIDRPVLLGELVRAVFPLDLEDPLHELVELDLLAVDREERRSLARLGRTGLLASRVRE